MGLQKPLRARQSMLVAAQERLQPLTSCRPPTRPFASVQGRRSRGRPAERSILQPVNAADFAEAISALPQGSVLAAAGVISAAGIAALAYFFTSSSQEAESAKLTMSSPGNMRKNNAVLVFGSTGKTGQQIVRQLLEDGRQVIAAARSSKKCDELFADLAIRHKGQLIIESGIDITNRSTISRSSLWEGVSQVAICVGPVFGRQEDGEMGFPGGQLHFRDARDLSIITAALVERYKEGMTSEKVDSEGVEGIIEECKHHIQRHESSHQAELAIPMSEKDLGNWEKIDDVIMGGKSTSSMQSGPNKTAVWSGNLNVDGGGFCGTRNKKLKVDLSAYQGIQLRVKGDGQVYKVNLKTSDRPDNPEDTYAATFATVRGDWQNIQIPFREFVAVTRAKTNPDAPPLDTRKIGQIGFRLSRFDFNNLPNPHYQPGPFRLEFEKGIYGYKDEQPAVVLVSSAAVERNALVGDDQEARKKDIPIVQLNPGGILNYKYKGEMALRNSGLPYCVVRPVGLTTDREHESFLLEASQGDTISGKISRPEVANVISTALRSSASKAKTIEVRRNEAESSRGQKPTAAQLERLFLAAIEDWQRPKLNLSPMPMVTEVPPPPSKERVKEILEDPRVKEAAERSRRQSSSHNGSQPHAQVSSDSNGATASSQMQESSGAQAEAKEWIQDWRERTKA